MQWLPEVKNLEAIAFFVEKNINLVINFRGIIVSTRLIIRATGLLAASFTRRYGTVRQCFRDRLITACTGSQTPIDHYIKFYSAT